MADQNSQFMAILTAVGEARLANAQALGIAWNITQLGVGDGNGAEPMPDRLQTALLNERRRAPLNQLKVDPSNASIIIAEQVIPEDVGGWWIREIGLYDETGDLVAVANCPPTFKPQLAQGSGRTQVVRLNLLVSSTQSITLKIDPSVVLATRAYCDGKVAEELAKLDHKQSVRAATTANITLSGTQTIDGIVLAVGDRVLVKNQSTASANGIYVVSGSAWTRATDADTGSKLNSGAVIPVEEGTLQGNSRWQLTTDGAVSIGSTSLVFADVTAGFAPLASPALTGNPTAPTPAQFDNDTSLATTEFVQRALGNYRSASARAGNQVLEVSDAGSIVVAGNSATPLTYTTPPLSAFVIGASVTIENLSRQVITLAQRTGSDRYISAADPTGTATQYVIKAGSMVTITKYGADLWLVHGNGDLINSPLFSASLAGNGYQKLPSGLIVQWGGGITNSSGILQQTLPITFPTAQLKGVCTSQGDENPTILTSVFSLTATAIDCRARTVGGAAVSFPISWIAFGY